MPMQSTTATGVTSRLSVLVTGGAGFIGSHVTAALLDAGHTVRVLDSLHPAAWKGAAPLVDPRASLVYGDVNDGGLVRDLLDGVDVVCHHAAMVGMGLNVTDLPKYVLNNDLGAAVVLAAMAEQGVARLVLASSMVVYGEGSYRCVDDGVVRPLARRAADLASGVFDPRCARCDQLVEWAPVSEAAPLQPRSGYAATKVAQEHLAAAWQRETGGDVIALRYHNVYGPRMPRDTPYAGVAAIFRSALAAGEAPRVHEDGGQVRDFVHVDDVAWANVLAVESTPRWAFTPLNIASGRPITVWRMAEMLATEIAGPSPLLTGQVRPGDVRHVVASPKHAASVLGFRAAIGPDEGLRSFAHAALRD